ncbi:MAG: hypothetical protein D4R84_03020 [Rhodocyclaceae bacterium]|nr:MAG: hypothetical protein D4R84_03020 [Rhodocyclaceae bacterium]
MHIGRLGAILSTLVLLHSAGAVAAIPDPVLKRSEKLDIRRLGKVSEDERAVLRIEWRAAVMGGDEARTVQDMLGSLQRLEQTMVEVGRLIRTMPAQKPVAAANAAEPPESDDFNWRLALANVTAAGMVALWWFRRRNSAIRSRATTGVAPSPQADFSFAPPPLGASPATAQIVEPPSDAEPPADTAPGDPSAVRHNPALAAPGAELLAEAPRHEARAMKETVLAEPSPNPPAAPAVEPMALPEEPETSLPVPSPATENPIIDFLLEDADPEVVAREEARLRRMKIAPPPDVFEEPEKSNVEPTLQLAEIMLSMGLEHGAAQALVEYTEANPRLAVYHWLKLLGIYRKKGLVNEFRETAEKLRQHFNIQAEDSTAPDTGEVPTLEQFSRVAKHVQEIWRQPEECITYLRHLLEDNREGARAGFPLSVAEELLWLIEILRETSGTAQGAWT